MNVAMLSFHVNTAAPWMTIDRKVHSTILMAWHTSLDNAIVAVSHSLLLTPDLLVFAPHCSNLANAFLTGDAGEALLNSC